jgi:hypothetical protein
MISMTLFTMIITSVIIAVENLSIARIKTLNRVALLEELYFFSEQLFTGIKDGGTLDYEEYWNRQAVGIVTSSWHYLTPTWVGNYGNNGSISTASAIYGSGIYLCRSNNGINMWSGWCLRDHNNSANLLTSWPAATDFINKPQRYGEYLAQFTDYNGNADADLWDEDVVANGSIVWDDDDRSIGDVSWVSTGAMQELYLINKNAKKRTYFRWNIQQDPNNTAIICGITDTPLTSSGCVGNVQILKLKWLDLWLTHSGDLNDKMAYDGIIDTWVCAEYGQCIWPVLPTSDQISTGIDAEWLDLFPSTINVKKLTFQIFPIKDPWISWAAPDCLIATCISPFIHPYVRMNLEMWFAWWKRRTLRNDDPTISISTSISLSDFE